MTDSDPNDVRAALDAALRRHFERRAQRDGAARSEPASGPRSGEHSSHARFALTRPDDTSEACLVEPTVVCTHCGYCVSFGH